MQNHIIETLKNYLCNKKVTITLIKIKTLRPSWTSQCKSARQSDKLQTLPNIMKYDSLS